MLKHQLEVLWRIDSGTGCFRALGSESLREEMGSVLLLIIESEDFTVASARGNKPDPSVFARHASVLFR